MNHPRRKFLKKSGTTALGLAIAGVSTGLYSCTGKKQTENGSSASEESTIDTSAAIFFEISLAQWSLHSSIFDGKMDNLDFAPKAKRDFGISAVEYVNQFFADKAEDQNYLAEMKKRADDNGVKSLLIMVDREGRLAELDDQKRMEAVENHYKWVEAAKFLGCHSIRVNAGSSTGTAEEVKQTAIDGLGKLAEFSAQHGINVIVENHGGYSSNGQWLAEVIKGVGSDYCGTLPDFGNFCIDGSANPARECKEMYDRYKGVKELMPFAKGVSAKSYSFDADGNEETIDYQRMLKIVKDAGYTGHVGIEYEGQAPEDEGIMATKKLLVRLGQQMS